MLNIHWSDHITNALVAPGSTLSRTMLMLSHFHLYGELRFSRVTGRRNGPSGLREDDDDEYECIITNESLVCRLYHKSALIKYIKLWDSLHLVILPCCLLTYPQT